MSPSMQPPLRKQTSRLRFPTEGRNIYQNKPLKTQIVPLRTQ
jgi:hypothetical protein